MMRSGGAAKKIGAQSSGKPPMKSTIRRMMMRSGPAMKRLGATMQKPSSDIRGFVQNERALNERIQRGMKKP